MGCSELGAKYGAAGNGSLTALELGDEAIVNVAASPPACCGTSDRWSAGWPRTATWPGVRGVGDIPPREIGAILRVADSWRGSQTERGFSR